MTTAHRPSCWICSQAKVWEEYGNPFCECSKTDPAHVTWYLDQHDAGRNEHEIAIVCKSYDELPPLTDTEPSSLAELI